MGNGFGKLPPRACRVASVQMIESDSRLNQSLIKDPERRRGNSPQILPGFMGFEEPASVKKKQSQLKEIRWGLGWRRYWQLIEI